MRGVGLPDVLDALTKYARTFDAISDEQDARYSATSFVKWVALETRGTARRDDDDERQPSPR